MKQTKFQTRLYSGNHVFLYSYKSISNSCFIREISWLILGLVCGLFAACFYPVSTLFVPGLCRFQSVYFLQKVHFQPQKCRKSKNEAENRQQKI